MKLKGKYILEYIINKIPYTMEVEVVLKKIKDIQKPFQNVWEGHALLNEKPYEDEKLKYCVDAKLYAQTIGLREKDKLRKEYGRKLRVKKEILK